MRKRILFLCVFWAAAVHAQTAGRLGIIGGIHQTNLTVEDQSDNSTLDYDSKNGLALGVLYYSGVSPYISIQGELLYSQKGAKFTDEDMILNDEDMILNLNYIDLDLLAKLNLANQLPIRPSLLGGMYAGLNLKAQAESESTGKTEDVEAMKGVDYGFILGGGLDLGFGASILNVSVRYNQGMANIFKGNSDYSRNEVSWKNHGVSFLASIIF
jgi:hypothetical protein